MLSAEGASVYEINRQHQAFRKHVRESLIQCGDVPWNSEKDGCAFGLRRRKSSHKSSKENHKHLTEEQLESAKKSKALLKHIHRFEIVLDRRVDVSW